MTRVTQITLTEPQAMLVSHGVILLSAIIFNDKQSQTEVGQEMAACMNDGSYTKDHIREVCMMLEKLAEEWEKE